MELTANIFIILSAILAATSMYFYLQNRRNKNKLETSNSLLKSEENHRILIEDMYKKEVVRQAETIFEYKSKLKFAINNPPKFKVGDKVKNVVVESIIIHKNTANLYNAILKGLFSGVKAGFDEWQKSKSHEFYYKYKLIHKDHYKGQKLHKECEVLTEEQLLKLKNNKTNK